MKETTLAQRIKHLADSTGIDALGFADASEFTKYALPDSKRRNPKRSMADASTIIVAGVYIGGVTLPAWANPWYGRTSRLYLSEFFLDVVQPLKPIADLLKQEGHRAIICDSATEQGSILPLKLAAIRAGLGWQGKHSLLISPQYGTFLALGGIITNASLTPNSKQVPDRCGKCDKCQQACPVQALAQAHVLNRNKCLSNALQVDNLSVEAQLAMGNRVADCEICQDVCPWNQKHIKRPLTTKLTETFRKKIKAWEAFFYLPDLIHLTEEEYNQKLGHLRIDIPYAYFRRNVEIALETARKSGKPARR